MQHCNKCEKDKPPEEFYPSSPTRCKSCCRRVSEQSAARRRKRMGEEAWLAYKRDQTNRSRQKTNNAQGKIYNRARRKAFARLANTHPEEFHTLFNEELAAEYQKQINEKLDKLEGVSPTQEASKPE